MNRTIIAAALAAIALVPAAHAAAPKQVAVAYGDLDLGTATGRAELNNRLHAAAGALCGPALRWDKSGSEQSVREHRELHDACIGRLSERAMAKTKIGRD